MKEIIENLIDLTDSLSELNLLIERINILSDDLCGNHIEKIDFRTERGRVNAEIDFSIIKVMADVIHDHITEASEISENLPKLSTDILESLKVREKA